MKTPFALRPSQTAARSRQMHDEVTAVAELLSVNGYPSYVFAMSIHGGVGVSIRAGERPPTKADMEALAARLEREAAALRRLAA